MRKKQILVVCRGNIVRSPFAQKILEKEVKNRKLARKLSCLSRGVQGSIVDPIPPRFSNIKFYKNEFALVKPFTDKLKIDLSAHVSQTISVKDIADSDIIIAMDDKTVESIVEIFKKKIIKISELVDKSDDVKDPEGITSKTQFEKVLNDINTSITLGFDKLLEKLNI